MLQDNPKLVEHKAIIGSYSVLLLAGWELYNIEVVHLDPFGSFFAIFWLLPKRNCAASPHEAKLEASSNYF